MVQIAVAGTEGTLKIRCGRLPVGLGQISCIEIYHCLLDQYPCRYCRAGGLNQLYLGRDAGGFQRGRQSETIDLDADDEIVDKDPCRHRDDGEGYEDDQSYQQSQLLPDGNAYLPPHIRGITQTMRSLGGDLAQSAFSSVRRRRRRSQRRVFGNDRDFDRDGS